MPFRTAISGMRAAMTDLNVIGNNVANASTAGFKRSRAEFADVYAASNIGVSGNAAGAGVNTARVAQQFSQGTVNFTDNSLDLAINGNGFFVLEDTDGGQVFSRSGAFGLDRDGFVVNAQSQKLVVFQADATGAISGATGPMQISTADIPPQATAAIEVGINLDAASIAPVPAFNPTDTTSYNNATSTTIYDSLGNSHLATMYYRKTAANTWETHLYVDGAAVDGPDTLAFNTAGALTTPAGGTLTAPAFTPAGAAAITLTLDYGTATQFGSPFSVNRLTQDGFTTGRLSGLDVDNTGVIFARFTNGQSAVQGQVALANFSNPQGLQQLGDNNWAETFGSGAALIAGPGSSSLGLIQSGALEESNVDLSEELVKMIIAQRNFQANTQVISTANQVTQAVINIR